MPKLPLSGKRLLCTVAHPDDETFGAGGALIHAASNGARVDVVCATRGDVGEIAEGSGATPETLPQVREREFHAASRLLGVEQSLVLGYRDSGMPGTPDNKDARAFINQPQSQVVGDIVRVIRKTRPDVVLTMDEGGGYGHPDHVFMTRCTLDAVALAGDADYSPPPPGGRDGDIEAWGDGPGDPWEPSAVYFFVFPRSRFRKWLDRIRDSDPDSPILQMDPDAMGVPDDAITGSLDVSAHVGQLKLAMAEHRSQYSPLQRFPDEMVLEFMSTAFFIRVVPKWTGGPSHTGLFQPGHGVCRPGPTRLSDVAKEKARPAKQEFHPAR